MHGDLNHFKIGLLFRNNDHFCSVSAIQFDVHNSDGTAYRSLGTGNVESVNRCVNRFMTPSTQREAVRRLSSFVSDFELGGEAIIDHVDESVFSWL